jgi:enoyl-[acyl-carrier-protein] reductase (NADH)
LKGGKVESLFVSDGFAGRLAESREQGDPLVFLCSEMASFISGVMLDVDFGFDSQILAGNNPDPLGFKMLSK